MDGAVAQAFPPRRGTRWARRLGEMALVFDATERPEAGRAGAGRRRRLRRQGAARRVHRVRPRPRPARARGGGRGHPRPRAAGRREPRPGPAGHMIPGIRVGHATDATALTGCTVILPDAPAVGGVEIRGWAAGVHGLEFLDPRHLVPTVDGVVLAGGSAYGLEAIWGVMDYLEEHGIGFPVSRTVVPHVAGAILFDLGVGDHRVRPDRAMGHAAARAAAAGTPAEGNVGAGTGATVGKLHRIERAMRGGLGCAVVDGRRVVGRRHHGGERGGRRARSRGRPPRRGRARRAGRPPARGHRRRAGRRRAAARVPARQHDHRLRRRPTRGSPRPEAAWVAALGMDWLRPRAVAAAPGHRRRHALLPLRGRARRRSGRGGQGSRAGGGARHRARVWAAVGLPGLPAARDLDNPHRRSS